MKPALYYAIRKNLYSTIVAVTSEKGTRRWHGRDCQYNEATHGTFDQLRGKFNTLEEAEACRKGIEEIAKHYEGRRRDVQATLRLLYRQEADNIEDYIKGKLSK